jgi:hypothetical protein
MRNLPRLVLLPLLVASLSGCSSWRSAVNYIRADSATSCPDAAILATTSSIPVFDPAKGGDPSSVQYTAKMTNVTTRCDFNKRTLLADANLKIFVTATRPPGGEEAHYRLPYFIAVTNNGEIQDKKTFWMEFDFDEGDTAAMFEEDVDSFEVVTAKQNKGYDYHMLVGFQLTKAQLEYNKKMGQFSP